jgi:YgiT-type zinc finger domain-containing protein
MRTCRHCRVGILQRKSITYANWHAGHFVTVPNTPAWQCDVCAYCEVEAEAIQRLLVLLGPATPAEQVHFAHTQKSTASEPVLDELGPDHQVI